MAKLEGVTQVGGQELQVIAQQRDVAFQGRRQLEEDGPEPARAAQGVDHLEEERGGLGGVLEAQDVGDAHVRLDGEDEAGPVCATQFSSVEAEGRRRNV